MAVQKSDINPSTGQAYAVNPASGVWDDTYWSEVVEPSLGGGSGSSRNTPLDLSSIPSSLGFAKELATSEDLYLKALTERMGQREQPLSIYSRLEEEANMPEMRASSKALSQEVSSLEDAIRSVGPNVAARTRESMVTEAQRQGMVLAGQEPLQEKLARTATALSRIGGQISSAEQGIGTKVGLALEGQKMDLEPYQLRFATFVDRNARYLSAFTSDKQTELERLIMNWQRGNTVSDQDWARMNELADNENEYIKRLKITAAEAGADVSAYDDSFSLLTLIGRQAQEEIDWQRLQDAKTGSGTASERQQALAEASLVAEAKAGVTYNDLLLRYSEIVPTYRIRELYNSVNPPGKGYGPAQESAAQELELTSTSGPY